MTCMICGCTDEEACINRQTGERCTWAEFGPDLVEVRGYGLCTFCALPSEEAPAGYFRRRQIEISELHAALDRGLNKPTDSERDEPLVELVTDHEADLFLRARRAGA